MEKELCMSKMWHKIEEKRKLRFRLRKNKGEIDFLLIKKKHRRFLQNVKAIPIQQALVGKDIDKKKIKKVVGKTCIEIRKM